MNETENPAQFPILPLDISLLCSDEALRNQFPKVPRFVSWRFIETFRIQIETTHRKTLEKFAEEGSLDVLDLYAAMRGEGIREIIGYARLSDQLKLYRIAIQKIRMEIGDLKCCVVG